MIKDASYALTLEKYPKKYIDFLEEEMNLVKRIVKGRKTLLDVGCGTGRAFSILASLVDDYTAIDIDKKCIERSMEEAKKFDNVKVILLDGEELSQYFKTNQFEVSISLWNTLGAVSNPNKFLSEILKVTQKICFLSVIKKGTLKERKEYYDKLNIEYVIDYETETISSKTWGDVKAYSKEEIISLCESVGFKVKEIGELAELSYYLILEKTI